MSHYKRTHPDSPDYRRRSTSLFLAHAVVILGRTDTGPVFSCPSIVLPIPRYCNRVFRAVAVSKPALRMKTHKSSSADLKDHVRTLQSTETRLSSPVRANRPGQRVKDAGQGRPLVERIVGQAVYQNDQYPQTPDGP